MNILNTIIIIPAYNESENIQSVVNELKNIFSELSILVVDDCSADRTADIVRNRGVNCISLPFNVGYSGALQTGYKYAVKCGYDYVVQFDGDGQHIAGEINKLIATMEITDADIVIGSRFITPGAYYHPFMRKVGTGLFCVLIKLICGVSVHDPTSGFQLLRRDVFERYSRMHNFPYFPDANLIIEMLMKNYKLAEVQVDMRERAFGESMHSGMLKPAMYMVKVVYSIFIIIIKYLPKRLSGKAT